MIVDLPAQSDRLLAAWIKEAGVLEIAAESGVSVVFWHVIDDGKDALTTLDRVLARYGESARYCIVKNLGRGRDFSLYDRSATRDAADRLGAGMVELPELYAAAMQKIDRLDASFWSPSTARALVALMLSPAWIASGSRCGSRPASIS